MLTCIIIDDEPNAVNLLSLLIKEATEWEIKATCYNGLEALKALKIHQVDFIFLDINMPELSGMELAALLPKDVKVIFTTAYSEYAAESYLHHTIDYILKPITLKRFLITAQKIEAWFRNSQQHSNQDTNKPDKYLYVKSGKSIHKVQLQDILYIGGEKEYIRMVTVKENLLVYRRLKDIEQQLTYPFIRVHNSYVINLELMDKYVDNHIIIKGEKIPVSDKYRIKFMDHLNKKTI